jgi:hypothetical protein
MIALAFPNVPDSVVSLVRYHVSRLNDYNHEAFENYRVKGPGHAEFVYDHYTAGRAESLERLAYVASFCPANGVDWDALLAAIVEEFTVPDSEHWNN